MTGQRVIVIHPGDVMLLVRQQAPCVLPGGAQSSAVAVNDLQVPGQHVLIIGQRRVTFRAADMHTGLIGMIPGQIQEHQAGILRQHRQA